MKLRSFPCILFLAVIIGLPADITIAQPRVGATTSGQITTQTLPSRGPFHGLTLRLYGLAQDRITQDLVSDLLLIDPQGRRTGKDPIAKMGYEEIPNSGFDEDMVGRPMKEFDIREPLDGSYLVQVIGTARGSYDLYIRPQDETAHSPNQPTFDNIPTVPGMIHAYRLEYTRTPGVLMKVTGGLEGGEETQGEVDKFLTYAYPTAPQSELRGKQTSFPLVILYGSAINPTSLRATLNGTNISRRFKPVPGSHQVVPLKFVRGSHTLVLSVEGTTATGQVATDTDRLLFLVR